MLVRQNDIDEILEHFSTSRFIALDTETTGLHTWKGHRLFSVIMYDGKKEPFYFNFKEYPDLAPEWVLPKNFLNRLLPIFILQPKINHPLTQLLATDISQ